MSYERPRNAVFFSLDVYANKISDWSITFHGFHEITYITKSDILIEYFIQVYTNKSSGGIG